MRLWSIHPQYLDAKGLVAVWREALLAKSVLKGKTKGYTKHPQLIRFKKHPYPLKAINYYLLHILNESKKRGYSFDQSKINKPELNLNKINVSSGQISFEFRHLIKKLRKRDAALSKKLDSVKKIRIHSLFQPVKGKIEPWEKSFV